MMEEYKAAQKAGLKAYRARVSRGQPPYLAVLDDILLNVTIASQENLGLVDLPVESIVGTKTSGRQTAFANNFMPLLSENTEFAIKWANLSRAHLEEGIRDPVTAYEFLNRFYIEEGNKRVSVLRYYGAVTIPANVIRLVPAKTDSIENKIYYEFLDFYKLSRILDLSFSRPGSYAKLQQAICKGANEEWNDNDRMNFVSFLSRFRQQFLALGGDKLSITAGDAMLTYLSVHRYSQAIDATMPELRQGLSQLWPEILALQQPKAVQLSLEPTKTEEEPSLLERLNPFSTRPNTIFAAFVHEYNAKTSPWVQSHKKAVEQLRSQLGDQVVFTQCDDISPEVDAEQTLTELAEKGADVIFVTCAQMLPACLKVAARYPKTKILDCTLNVPHPLVRTFYPRSYEASFLLGMLAGVLSETDRVGYNAASPVYGVPAGINAFAQGLRAVRPKATVLLRWNCCPDPACPADFSDQKDIGVFFARDDREEGNIQPEYGLARRMPDGSLEMLGSPLCHWEVFYRTVLRALLNGSYDGGSSEGKAINYWWGLDSGALELHYSYKLPIGTLQLLELMEMNLRTGALQVFPSTIYAQGHISHTPAGAVYTPDELMQMDWLDECVEGGLPDYESLDVKTRRLIELRGVHRMRHQKKN